MPENGRLSGCYICLNYILQILFYFVIYLVLIGFGPLFTTGFTRPIYGRNQV